MKQASEGEQQSGNPPVETCPTCGVELEAVDDRRPGSVPKLRCPKCGRVVNLGAEMMRHTPH